MHVLRSLDQLVFCNILVPMQCPLRLFEKKIVKSCSCNGWIGQRAMT